MKSRPILYKTEMVKAILAGSKTQTRRTRGLEDINGLPDSYKLTGTNIYNDTLFAYFRDNITGWLDEIKCPFGIPGDELWVKETYMIVTGFPTNKIYYKADDPDLRLYPEGKWKSSLFMKREYSRIQLKIKSIGVERVQDISEGDAMAEGVKPNNAYVDKYFITPKKAFENLWNSINAKKNMGWNKNPWLWKIEFERIKP